MRGLSKSHDQYPFLKFLYGMNISTDNLEMVALRVPSALLNLKKAELFNSRLH